MITWIKLSTALFDDEKIAIIESVPEADSLLVMWVKLLIQAGKCNAGGLIWLEEGRPYTEEMLASVLRRPLNTVRLALQTFTQLGMIEQDPHGIRILSWERHQNCEALERIRESARLRKARQRMLLKEVVTGQSRDSHTNVTPQDKDIEREKEKEKEKEEIPLRGAMAPFDACHNFEDFKLLLESGTFSTNEVGFLVNVFKQIHHNAPASDLEQCGGRLARLWRDKSRDTGFILQVLCDTAQKPISGSHLNFIQAILTGPKRGAAGPDPDKFVQGKYGHMVQR